MNPETGEVYGPDFPLLSIRDNVRAQARVLDSLGIGRLRLVLGGSIGGMQALDWSILYPDRVERAAIIAVAPLGAMGLALNHLQRQAILNDPDWEGWSPYAATTAEARFGAGQADCHAQLQVRGAL